MQSTIRYANLICSFAWKIKLICGYYFLNIFRATVLCKLWPPPFSHWNRVKIKCWQLTCEKCEIFWQQEVLSYFMGHVNMWYFWMWQCSSLCTSEYAPIYLHMYVYQSHVPLDSSISWQLESGAICTRCTEEIRF